MKGRLWAKEHFRHQVYQGTQTLLPPASQCVSWPQVPWTHATVTGHMLLTTGFPTVWDGVGPATPPFTLMHFKITGTTCPKVLTTTISPTNSSLFSILSLKQLENSENCKWKHKKSIDTLYSTSSSCLVKGSLHPCILPLCPSVNMLRKLQSEFPSGWATPLPFLLAAAPSAHSHINVLHYLLPSSSFLSISGSTY